MVYICIHNETKIEYKEEYPTETKEEINWANKNVQRLIDECQGRMPELWTTYASIEKQFTFEKPAIIEKTVIK